jgi:hypothetical protein
MEYHQDVWHDRNVCTVHLTLRQECPGGCLPACGPAAGVAALQASQGIMGINSDSPLTGASRHKVIQTVQRYIREQRKSSDIGLGL